MTYELAKELKEAGFPQSEEQGCFIPDPNCQIENCGAKEICAVYEPTLEELIEAIVRDRRNTFSLDYDEEWSVYEEPNKDGPWSARYYDLTPVGFYVCGAKTPLEAVARLWLALNKKG